MSNERVLYRVPQVMALLSMNKSRIYELIRSGRLRSVKGRSRLIAAAAIREYVVLLERESGQVA